MKTLTIPKIKLSEDSFISLSNVILLQGVRADINTVNWAGYPYKPRVIMHVGHTATHLWFHFFVSENHVLAANLEHNSNVWEDSCVEIFIGDPDGVHYFNFENNCIGTGLVARRLSQTDFELFPVDKVAQVVRLSSLPHQLVDDKDGGTWQLVVGIPFELIGLSAAPKELRGNFYKCGDNTATPHFLSWAPIDTPTPSFHQPKFFGRLILE